jgi:hypothetical protein
MDGNAKVKQVCKRDCKRIAAGGKELSIYRPREQLAIEGMDKIGDDLPLLSVTMWPRYP